MKLETLEKGKTLQSEIKYCTAVIVDLQSLSKTEDKYVFELNGKQVSVDSITYNTILKSFKDQLEVLNKQFDELKD